MQQVLSSEMRQDGQPGAGGMTGAWGNSRPEGASLGAILVVALAVGLAQVAGVADRTGETNTVGASTAYGPVLLAGPQASDEQRLMARAATDPIGLLEEALMRCERTLRDCRGTFILQETIKGKRRARAVCRFKFRSEPFSVALEWQEGQGRIKRLLYVSGKNDGRMVVHPTGLGGALFPVVELDPHSRRAMESSSRPVTSFGLRNALGEILRSYRASAADGTLRSKCSGFVDLHGKKALRLERTDPGGKTIMDLEVATLLPLAVRRFGPDGKLMSMYAYRNLELNVGLGDSAFSRSGNGFSDVQSLVIK